jgi:signal peptidase I
MLASTEEAGAVKTKAKGQEKSKDKPQEGHRETVEALVVAFILALLVRGFEAEAFVIPTGSMAPTLMGRHKEIDCPRCGFTYAVNASDEDERGRGFGGAGRTRETRNWVVAGTCVNCRHQAALGDLPTFNGDRILVMKFPYDIPWLPGASPPERWDVVVFRYPEDPEVSYIKRLIGLPGETIRIYFGDVYVKSKGEDEFRIARKPLRHQQAMQIMVYDDRFRPEPLTNVAGWDRWFGEGALSWAVTAPKGPNTSRVFSTDAPAGQFAELRYQHVVPDPEQWRAIEDNVPLPHGPRRELVGDFYSYNTNYTEHAEGDAPPKANQYSLRGSERDFPRQHWVGDLTIAAKLDVKKAAGLVRFELIEGGESNRCEIDLSTGAATLYHGNDSLGMKTSKVNHAGQFAIMFANVDDRLTLLIDDEPLFGDGLNYSGSSTSHPAPTEDDLTPVRIAASGTSIAVSDLVLKRDIYYTQTPGGSDYSSWDQPSPLSGVEMLDILADSARFPELANLKWRDYEIGADRFMMLGDNSPRSKDSRGWSTADASWDTSQPPRSSWEVPRALLTGKAFYIYWPHGRPWKYSTSLINRDIRFPFWPYFSRMRWIR